MPFSTVRLSRRKLLAAPALAWPAALRAAANPASPMKITKVLTYKSTLRWRDLLFVEVHTDSGLVGLGEGTCHNRVEVVESAIRWLEPYLVGQDPAGVQNHWDRMYYRLTRWRSGIILMTALSAIDIALWDIEGKRLGVPVWRLLGGPIHERFRVYYTHWNNTMKSRTPADFASRARESVAQGWTAVKFAMLRGATETARINDLVAIFAAIRQAVGDRLDIGLELAETCTTRMALDIARALAPYRPLFLEEPIPRENAYAFGQLAAQSPVAIATGEGHLSRHEFRPLLEEKGVAIVQPDVVKCGGITELIKIANLAETYGVEVAPHQCYGPVAHVASLAAMSVCRNFLIHEWEADDDALFREHTRGLYPIQKDGYVTLPQGPGLGIEFNGQEFARRFPFAPKRG